MLSAIDQEIDGLAGVNIDGVDLGFNFVVLGDPLADESLPLNDDGSADAVAVFAGMMKGTTNGESPPDGGGESADRGEAGVFPGCPPCAERVTQPISVCGRSGPPCQLEPVQ